MPSGAANASTASRRDRKRAGIYVAGDAGRFEPLPVLRHRHHVRDGSHRTAGAGCPPGDRATTMTPFHTHTSTQKQWRLLMPGTRLYVNLKHVDSPTHHLKQTGVFPACASCSQHGLTDFIGNLLALQPLPSLQSPNSTDT